MTDQFPGLETGECLDLTRATIIDCTVVTAAVVKGQLVALTDVAGTLPSVCPAGAASVIANGIVVAYKDGGTGAVGEKVSVGFKGVFKGLIGNGGVTAGKTFISDAWGHACDGNTIGAIIGRSMQTGPSGDTALLIL
jgi:hypothetical protein